MRFSAATTLALLTLVGFGAFGIGPKAVAGFGGCAPAVVQNLSDGLQQNSPEADDPPQPVPVPPAIDALPDSSGGATGSTGSGSTTSTGTGLPGERHPVLASARLSWVAVVADLQPSSGDRLGILDPPRVNAG
jgi:hypothetical protein